MTIMSPLHNTIMYPPHMTAMFPLHMMIMTPVNIVPLCAAAFASEISEVVSFMLLCFTGLLGEDGGWWAARVIQEKRSAKLISLAH